ncbi:MAG TPA: hypothetical protein VJS37_16150 [Terriglobales bacterium]|jgi:hypothetical protein|nr:hypothetical protein [Terriglobales bacterium]
MLDWQKAIREKLARVTLSPRQRANLIAELANHLEDLHAELLTSGVSAPDASRACLEQLSDLQQIASAAKQSQIGEGRMNQRSKTLWLPGLVTLTMASVLLMVMQLYTFSRPRVHWVDGGEVAVGIVWLLSLLPCGALGAYLSRRAGGSRWISILASLFPSLIMLAVFCVVLPIGILVERNTYIIHHPRYFGLALLVWTVVPGAALLLGALPVLRRRNAGRLNTPQTTP